MSIGFSQTQVPSMQLPCIVSVLGQNLNEHPPQSVPDSVMETHLVLLIRGGSIRTGLLFSECPGGRQTLGRILGIIFQAEIYLPAGLCARD